MSELIIEEPKTRVLARLLNSLGLEGRTLIVRGAADDHLERAARNLPYVKIVEAHELNVRDVLLVDNLLVPQQEIERVREAWS